MGRRLHGQIVVAIDVAAVVRLDRRNSCHLQQAIEQAGKPDFAERMSWRTDSAECIDPFDHLVQRQIAVAPPQVPAVVRDAVGQQVPTISRDFHSTQHQQPLLPPDAFDRLGGLVGIVLRDADTIQAESLRAPDQVKRLQPVVVRIFRMTVGIDPHDPSRCRLGLREARTRS